MEPDSPTANATPAEADGVPSLRGQLGATIDAVKRLLQAHVDLAKAELSEVVDEVKRMAALAGLALAALLMLGILVTLGGLLFLGEWLFGSIGWGVVLGGQLLLDVALIALFAALELRGRSIGLSFVVAALIGLGVGLVFGLDLSHRGWSAVGDAIAPTVDPTNRTVLVAIAILAGLGGLAGLLGGLRGGIGGAIAGLIGGGLIGAFLGWLTGISMLPTVGAALGVLVWLLLWPLLAGLQLARTGVDGEALKARFMPGQTIEMTKETIEWVRAQTPLARKS